MALRCDLKRGVSYQQHCAAQRGLLLCDAHVAVDAVAVNLGHRDLATLRAVWSDNLSEARYIGNYTDLRKTSDVDSYIGIFHTIDASVTILTPERLDAVTEPT